MNIFCYGSNMNTERITERCSSSRFISRAKVNGWKLLFASRLQPALYFTKKRS